MNEITALHQDIERIADGGASFRLIIGEYGSGKTFFLSVVRSIALEKKLVTVSADLSPDRRIHSSGGQARNLYSELMKICPPETNQMAMHYLALWKGLLLRQGRKLMRTAPLVSSVIHKRLAALSDMVGGYDFAKVIDAFWRGHEQDNETLKSNAIRWLRGEYTTKTDARNDLDVRTIISDASFYDSLKLMSLFVRQAGYAGLLVSLDEMVNLFKLNNTQARTANYEQILRILNDCLQGSAENIGFILGGRQNFFSIHVRGSTAMKRSSRVWQKTDSHRKLA